MYVGTYIQYRSTGKLKINKLVGVKLFRRSFIRNTSKCDTNLQFLLFSFSIVKLYLVRLQVVI